MSILPNRLKFSAFLLFTGRLVFICLFVGFAYLLIPLPAAAQTSTPPPMIWGSDSSGFFVKNKNSGQMMMRIDNQGNFTALQRSNNSSANLLMNPGFEDNLYAYPTGSSGAPTPGAYYSTYVASGWEQNFEVFDSTNSCSGNCNNPVCTGACSYWRDYQNSSEGQTSFVMKSGTSGTAPANNASFASAPISVVAGQTYNVQFDYKCTATGNTNAFSAFIIFYNAGNSLIYNSPGSTGAWNAWRGRSGNGGSGTKGISVYSTTNCQQTAFAALTPAASVTIPTNCAAAGTNDGGTGTSPCNMARIVFEKTPEANGNTVWIDNVKFGQNITTSTTDSKSAAYVSSGIFGSNTGYGNFSFYKDASTPILQIDATNSRVGIGTTSPGEKLQVSNGTQSIKIAPGSPNAIRSDDWGVDLTLTTAQSGGTVNTGQLYLSSTGNVGIGTTAPNASAKLDVVGRVNASVGYIQPADTGYEWWNQTFTVAQSVGNFQLTHRKISDGTWTNALTILAANNNVGIGTTTPTFKFQTVGTYADIDGGNAGSSAIASIYSNNAGAINAGGTMVFGGNTGNAVPTYSFAGLKGAKSTAGADGNYGGYLAFYTTNQSNSAFGERMRLDNAGNVGIGVTAPIAKLDVMVGARTGTHPTSLASAYFTGALGATDGFRIVHDNSSQGIAFGFSGIQKLAYNSFTGTGNLSIDAMSTGNLLLQTISTGNVGIGVTSPTTARTEIVNSAASLLLLKNTANPIDTEANVLFQLGSAPTAAGRIRSIKKVWAGDTGHAADLALETYYSTGYNTGQLYLKYDGNVGIGTTVPPYKLSVYNGDTSYAYFGPNASWAGKLLVGAGTNQAVTQTAQVISTDGNLHIDPAPSKNMYLGYYQARDIYINPNGGNVGIGTTSPGAPLHVLATSGRNSPLATIQSTGVTGGGSGYDVGLLVDVSAAAANTSMLNVKNGGTSLLYVRNDGNVGIGTNPSYKLHVAGNFYSSGSSRQFKENIENLQIDTNKLYQLQPVSFDFKPEYKGLGKILGGGKQFGLIAEDVAKLIPELAIREKDGGPVTNVDYERFSVLLLNELKKQKAAIDSLRQENQNLSDQLNSIKQELDTLEKNSH